MSRTRIRALRPVTAMLLGAALVTTGAPQALAVERTAPAVQASKCGPMDVAFVVDDTGSMGGALANLKAGISSSIIPQIASLSGGDYQLGLVTFKDTVTVLDDLAPGNQASVTAHVNALTATGGGNEPEASDEGLNTAVNRLPAGPPRPQSGSFNGVWRTNAMKIAVLLTDARPGGFDDAYTAADSANAHARATQAVTNGIRLSSVYVHTSTAYDSTIIPVMQDYANTTGGQYTVTAQNGSGTATAIQQILDSCQKRTDVYIADATPDVGVEPDTVAPSVYWSPDIKVCPTTANCAPGGNPVVGVTNYIRVTLHNPGPYGSGTSLGSLHLYRTPLSGATTWNPATGGDWVPINTVNLSVPPGTTTAVVPWTAVPGPGHFCLLARWVSGTDPMTFAEGPNTVTNTRNNNNIAWHNVDTVRLAPGSSDTRPFTLGNPLDEALVSDLTFTPVGQQPFVGPNRLVVDLGATLAQRWKQAGQPGVGVRAVGETQVEITDPRNAQIKGLVVNRGERLPITLRFMAGQTTGPSTLNVAQVSKDIDYGGVKYLPIVG